MNLLDYLQTNFLTEQQLLDASLISLEQLNTWQAQGKMPQASYTLQVQLDCASFFGRHQEESVLRFYPKGSPAWLGALQAGIDAKAVFTRRYQQGLLELAALGQTAPDLEAEWGHFLAGTYGVCTRSGLPEDIAAKELAIAVIKEEQALTHPPSQRLSDAIDLLDAASAQFAPHERDRSSRHRYITSLENCRR